MLRRNLWFAFTFLLAAGLVVPDAVAQSAPAAAGAWDYRLLATNKTSTMQKEMNQAADAGFRFQGVMGGQTAFGGNEVVTIFAKPKDAPAKGHYKYLLLATNRTSTMQKEMQQAGDEGFEYKGQTVFQTAFGGQEVVVILERDTDVSAGRWEYRLLATKKTSTMQKELLEAGEQGFSFVGVTVAQTAFGGPEVVCITRRPAK
ncbi:MAG: hypothetical protein HY234_01250 [Acidobacteria bacterium]|nr:hypothetical protein [Acidobacteriota bacterium]